MAASKPKSVIVTWVDSASWSGWQPVDRPRVPPMCETRGIVVERTEKWISIAQTVSFDEDGKIDSVCDVMAIPMVAIRSIKRGS